MRYKYTYTKNGDRLRENGPPVRPQEIAVNDTSRGRQLTPEQRDAEAVAAWMALVDLVTDGKPDKRRTWDGFDALSGVVGQIGEGRQQVEAVTGRHFETDPQQPPESLGMTYFELARTSAGEPVLQVKAGFSVWWLTPEQLRYLPCPADPKEGVFVLSVADPITAPPGQKLPAAAYLRDPDHREECTRLVAGGLILVRHDGVVAKAIQTAPKAVWNDFAALQRWVSRLIGTPAPRTTEEGLDDPAVLEGLREAYLARRENRAETSKKVLQADVDAIACAALEQGLQPTVLMMTRVLGKGSASTLHPMLKSYYARAKSEGLFPDAKPAPAPTWPSGIVSLVEQLRAAAQEEAAAALEPQRAALRQREQTADTRETEFAAAFAQLEEDRAQDARTVQERERFIEHLQGQLKEHEATEERLRNTVSGHEVELASQREQLEQRRQWIEEKTQRTVELAHEVTNLQELVQTKDLQHAIAAAELATTQQERDTLETKLASLQTKFEGVTTNLGLVKQRCETTEQDRSRMQQRVEHLERERDGRLQNQGKLEALIHSLKIELDTLRPLPSTVADLRTSEASLQAELRVVREEHDRLRTQRLSPKETD